MSALDRAPGVQEVGLGCPCPIFEANDLDAALAFYARLVYARLGFAVRLHDAGYGYAQRERLRIHVRVNPRSDPLENQAALHVETAEVDALHAEWLDRGLWLLPRASLPRSTPRRAGAGRAASASAG